MRDYPKDTIKELISFLIAEGYLQLVGTQYPIVQLTEASYGILKGGKSISIKRVLVKENKKAYTAENNKVMDHILFEHLRKIRQTVAEEQRIQPFMVFADTTLKEMARFYPVTQEEMMQITGVGEYKMEKYGEIFLEIVRNYVAEYPLEVERIKLALQEERQQESFNKVQTQKSAPRDSYKRTYELYRAGRNLDEIADERDLTRMTVENHLIKCVQEGLEVNYADFIPIEYEAQIIEAIEQCGTMLLKPIKECLPEEISYTAIKFMVAKYSLNK